MKFKIIKNTSEAILLEVIFENEIDKMSQKGFSGKEKFIKYTKGKNNEITLYNKDSEPYFSFHFGEGSTSMVSEETKVLRREVYHFILSNHIQPTKQTSKKETELKIMPPKKGLGVPDHYCVHLGGKFAVFLKTEKKIKEIFGEYEIYNEEIAETGVTVKHAMLKTM